MKDGDSKTLLISGASGQLGRPVMELLLEDGAKRIIATTRTVKRLADLRRCGVIVGKADFDDPESLADAFNGADRMLLVSTDAVDRPGHRVQQHQVAIGASRRAGISRIVYTSIPHPEPPSPVLMAADHWETERLLAASGISWTAPRNNLYKTCFSGRSARQLREVS
jgi:NAD(P)H dehydrogenase (quinone)